MKKKVGIIVIGLIAGIAIIISVIAGIVIFQIPTIGESKEYKEIKREYSYISEELYEKNIKQNQDAIQELKDSEDKTMVKRNIEHYIYYEQEENVAKCMEEINKMGYIVEQKEDRSCIVVKVNSTTEEKTIKEQNLKILNVAEKYELQYDGWGTEIVK